MRILPPNPLLQRRRGLSFLAKGSAIAACAAIACGCAKFPAGGETLNTHLIFRMKVAGHIKNGPTETGSNYIYIVAVNPSLDLNPTTQGPVPVIAPPWGNGFVAGNATHFIRYDYVQPFPYSVYKFANQDMIAYGLTGTPVATVNPGPEGDTLQFEVDLSQITPTGLQPADLQSVQVNFLTMDRIPQGNDTGSKIWDGLGDSRNVSTVSFWVTIPLNTSRIYSNADLTPPEQEPSGDLSPNDPDLDIIDWSVEVRRP